ncbi:MAG: PEP-CTERM sorting domain-containing protein, partial [Akkermansia sp.]
YVASVEVNMASGSTITDNGAEATTTVYQSINYATDAEVTFATSGEGQTLVMDKAVNNNVTAKIDGEGTVEFAGGATLASVSIAEDATLTLSSAVSSTNGVSGGSMAITADGSLTVGNTTVAAVEGSTAGFYLGTTGSIADGALTNANIQHAAISADSLSINGEVSLSNSSTSASVSVATGNILYMSGTSVAGGITLSGGTLQVGDTSLSNNLKLTASSSLNTADGVALELNSIITMSEGATLNLSGVGDVSLGTDFSLVLDYSLSEGAYTIFTNSATDFSGDITNYSIEGGFSSDYSYEWGTNEAGDIILTVAAAGSEPSSGEIYYNATTGEYTDASGATVTPGTESEVAFNSNSDTTAGTIVDEDLSVKSITKTGETTTTVTAGLTATGEIAIEQGTLALETDGSINSYTTVSEGASLSTKAMSITAADSADASITLGEGGYVDSYGYANAATVSNAQVTVNGTSFIYGSTIEADSKVDIQSGTLSIDDSSSLKASETKIASGAQIMLYSGYIVGQGEGGTLNIEDGGSLTTSGMSKAKVDSMLISINNGYTFEMNDSSLTATTVQLSNYAMMTLNGVTLGADTIFTSSTSYSLTSTRMMVGTQGMISMTGVNVLEASTLGGSLNIDDTDYSISTFGSGLSVSLDGTLTVNLVLSDTEWSTFLTQLGTENELSFTLNNFTGMDDSSIINLVINSESGDSLGYSASGLTSADFATGNLVISAATSAIIPEPSTATLSLLALAGLLARRRRKA